MKLINIIFIFFMVIGIAWGSAFAQENSIEERKNNIKANTLIPYLKAIQKGDVEKIKQFLSEEEYKTYRVLLEQNAGYSEFLRQHYKDVTFRVKEVTKEKVKEEGDFHYQVEVVFPDGKKEVHNFIVDGNPITE